MQPAPEPDMLRSFLEAREAPCPGCGYNLRGLAGSRCPECNQELQLQVGLVEPRLRAYLAAVIGLACGAGFSGLLLVYVLITVVVRSGGVPIGEILMFAGVPFVIEGFCLLLLVRSRPWFRSLPDPGRAFTITGCWLLTAANVTFFSFFIR